MPRVCVAIAVYNGADTLAKAVQSAKDQTFRDFSILVVDDGSTDDSASIALSMGCQVVHQENQGLGGARKRLVEESDSELIAFLDHDDYWVPDKLEKQIAALDESGASMAHSDCMYVYSDTGKIKSRFASIPKNADAFDHILPSNRVIASSAVFRREPMVQAGNFIRETVRCSDWYGWFLLASRGRFLHVPEVQVMYTVRSSSLANAGYEFHKSQRDLLSEQILPRFDEIFERCGEADRKRYRRQIQRAIGVATSSMAKHLQRMGRTAEARELHREALRLAGTVPRVWTRALRSRIGG
jgi:glycosyltransferase involved in cell wall biosynthesis